MLQRARGKVRQAREALKADAEGNVDRAAGHGGLSSDLLELAAVTEAVELTHGGTGSENKKKTELATPKQPGPPNASAATPTAVAAAAGGPAFPTLGVTLSFLERFTKEKVHGQPSRYCIAREDCDASSPDELSFKAGEILGIGDLGTFNNGWLVGYRRAGDWGDRLRFRAKAVQRLPGLSTDEVCGNIIKPETKAASWAADAVERSYAQMVRAGGGTGVGTANTFVSHAWTFVFEELIESLRLFEAQQLAAGRPPSYFWLDIFVVDENAAHTYPSEWWQTSFTQAVGSIGHTALVLTPWHSPVPLRRAWCLWEIYSTLTTQAKLSVCMSNAQNADFRRALVESADAVVSSLCTIDAETAEAGSKKDLDMIFAAVRTLEGGFQTLNVTVMQEMRSWILASVQQALAEVGLRFETLPTEYKICCAAETLDTVELSEMFECGCDCHDGEELEGRDQRLTFGNWYMRQKSGDAEMSICAEHYQQLSRMQKRKFKAVACVEDLGTGAEADFYAVRKTVLRGEVKQGQEAIAASILCAGTDLKDGLEAEHVGSGHAWDDDAALRMALALRVKVYGDEHILTAEPRFMLASCETDLDADETYELLVKAFEIQKRHLPDLHVDIAMTIKHIAQHWHVEREDPKTALPFALRAVRIFEQVDSEMKRVESSSSYTILADIFTDMGRIDDAMECYEKCYAMALKWLGPRHVETAARAANVSLHVESYFPHEIFRTVPLRRLDLKAIEVMAGMHNHQTADCRQSLACAMLMCIALHELREAEAHATAAGGSGVFAPGDRVRIITTDAQMHRKLSRLHGRWTHDFSDTQIKKLSGTDGSVVKIDEDGDVRVNLDVEMEDVDEACFNPYALILVRKAGLSTAKRAAASTPKFNKWGTWHQTVDQPLPKLSTICSGDPDSEQAAKSAIEKEAEMLLLSALEDIEGDMDFIKGASECCVALIDLYIQQKRKKELKTLRRRHEVIESWMSESSEDEDSDSESDSGSSEDEGNDASGSKSPSTPAKQNFTTLKLVYEMSPGLEAALDNDSDVHAASADLERVLEQIEILNTKRPPASFVEHMDRVATASAFRERLDVTRKRDQAAALLEGGWKSLVSEGTPPARAAPGSAQCGNSATPEDADSDLARGSSVSPQVLQTQERVTTVVSFIESHGDQISRSDVIRHLDTLGLDGMCHALEHKYGRHPELGGMSSGAGFALRSLADQADQAEMGCLSKDSYQPSQVAAAFLSSIETPLSPLEAELGSLKLGALSRKVAEAGATPDVLEALQNEDDPNAALIHWLVQRSCTHAEAAETTTAAALSLVPEGVPPEPAPSAPEPQADFLRDFDELSLAIETASPPSHGFGRVASTGCAPLSPSSSVPD